MFDERCASNSKHRGIPVDIIIKGKGGPELRSRLWAAANAKQLGIPSNMHKPKINPALTAVSYPVIPFLLPICCIILSLPLSLYDHDTLALIHIHSHVAWNAWTSNHTAQHILPRVKLHATHQVQRTS